MKSRTTTQKELLTRALARRQTFFTAEELHATVLQTTPTIGIATVYRFLKEQVACHHVHAFQCDRRTLYSTHAHQHCHFVCERCGARKHISIKNIDFLKSSIKEHVCHFQIDVYGICERCATLQSHS